MKSVATKFWWEDDKEEKTKNRARTHSDLRIQLPKTIPELYPWVFSSPLSFFLGYLFSFFLLGGGLMDMHELSFGLDRVHFSGQDISQNEIRLQRNNYPDWVNSCITAATSLTSWLTGIGSCKF